MTEAPGWLMPAQPLHERLRVITTTRSGGVSKGRFGSFNLAGHVGDDPAAVDANRRRLQRWAGCGAIQWLDQVHGTRVLHATSDTVAQTPAVDAAWTSDPDVALAVLTADCLPVVVCARDLSVVAVAHAGWRGLVDGVLESMMAALGGNPAGYRAWIGPAIGLSAYEVGADVADRVAPLMPAARALIPGARVGKYQLDLAAVAEQLLRRAGVAEVFASGICSATNRDLYSYRRDGETGRMATLVWRC